MISGKQQRSPFESHIIDWCSLPGPGVAYFGNPGVLESPDVIAESSRLSLSQITL